MSTKKSHETTANRIARKLGSNYNKNKGADINAPNMVVEVETQNTVNDGVSQLQGYKKPAYIAGANETATQRALKRTENTTIGVMNSQGKILKPSTRKKR
jgi:hypothetical protein